jgi:hypothetical protein
MLDRWKPRKGGKLPTEADLSQQRVALAEEVEILTAEQREINDTLVELMLSDPRLGDENVRRVGEIGILLPAKTRALGLLDQAIEDARLKEATAAEEAERERVYAEGKSAAAEHVKLIHAIIRVETDLADKLARSNELARTIANANGRRGDRPFIRDGEWTLRRRPGKPTPAVTTSQYVWVDARGNEVPDQICVGEGYNAKWISNPAAKEKAWIEKMIHPEHMNPDEPREPLTDAIRLVGMKGEQLWPR